MTAIGRNDACPCGSGRKYKRCCLGRDVLPLTFTAGERASALDALVRFTQRAEFDEAQVTATAAFWADWMDRHADDELLEAMQLEGSQTASLEWFAWDFRLANGRTLCEELLARNRDHLRSGELQYLEHMRLTHLRLYEIARVRPESGLDLVDLWTDDRVSVEERIATRQLVQWDLIAARVGLGARGAPVLEGFVYVYPAMARDDILARLRKAHRPFRRGPAGDDLVAFFKMHGGLFHALWLDHTALPPLPHLVTAEGDDLVLARVVFDVTDRSAVDGALSARADLQRQDDGSYAWLAAADVPRRRPRRRAGRAIQMISARVTDEAGPRATQGTIVLEGTRLVLETTSRPRAERGRTLIETLVGASARYRATAYEDIGQAARRRDDQPVPPSPVPPAIEARLLGDFYERHYRTWPDTPLPALSGRTPREAVQVKRLRPKLVALLKAMENGAERQRQQGRPAHDFGWMWGDLGLERPPR